MGLRFRKSVKICNGLRLNFGKTGASVTVGNGPLKKTFNTNGNVTTTVGIPGTGIYWTETERRGSRNNSKSTTPRQKREDLGISQSDYHVSDEVDDYFVYAAESEGTDALIRTLDVDPAPTPSLSSAASSSADAEACSITTPSSVAGLSAIDIKNLYLYSDAPVDWTELIGGATADELLMDPVSHRYCAQKASRILSGDVDAYLEAIDKMRPVDDLALYSGDFEFGTDNPTYIEVEFVTNPERVLRNGIKDELLKEFISAITIRVARDLFALLPVTKVLVHVEVENTTILSVLFERNKLCQANFKSTSARSIVNEFRHLIITGNDNLYDVGRLKI